MIEALLKIFGKQGKSSREIAHDRLKVVLIHDRLSVSPEVMDKIKTDIIHVISNYVEINLANDQDSVALIANIPVSRMKAKVSGGR